MPETVVFTDDRFLEDLRREAEARGRSLAEQIEHWAWIGRAIERSDLYDEEKVGLALAGQLDTTALTAVESAVWMARFTEIMSRPGPGEVAFHAARAARKT